MQHTHFNNNIIQVPTGCGIDNTHQMKKISDKHTNENEVNYVRQIFFVGNYAATPSWCFSKRENRKEFLTKTYLEQ